MTISHPVSHHRRTFELAASGLARVGRDGTLIDVNQSFADMMGYPRDALIGTNFRDITHPEDLQGNEDLLDDALAGRINGYRMQKRYLRGNGETLWADLNVSVERDDRGVPVSMISIVTDISAQKRAEERTSFLMGELSHRSKNLYAIVLNILQQTDAESVEAYREAISGRIMGLSASQDLMLAEGTHTTLAELVRRQLGAFVAPGDQRLVLEGEDPQLASHAVRVLGMALHELATNSCKYGALSTRTGTVTVTCHEDPTDAAWIVLCWIESGGPAVVPPETSGFGRQVIERMVSRALGADAAIRFDPSGLTWRCRVQREVLAQD